MKSFILALAVCTGLVASAVADTTVCLNGRCNLLRPAAVIHTDGTQSVRVEGCRSVTVVTAQEHADHLAATGTFCHCNRRGRGYEGIGFSTASPGDACKRACYWGQRRVREIGTSWCPLRRGWVAVVRYE